MKMSVNLNVNVIIPCVCIFLLLAVKKFRKKNNGGQAIKNVNKIKMFLCTGRLQKCSAEQERAIIKAFKSMQTILTSADITFI